MTVLVLIETLRGARTDILRIVIGRMIDSDPSLAVANNARHATFFFVWLPG